MKSIENCLSMDKGYKWFHHFLNFVFYHKNIMVKSVTFLAQKKHLILNIFQ